MSENKFLSLNEAARTANVSKRTIFRLLREKKLNRYKDGKKTLIDSSELAKYAKDEAISINGIMSRVDLGTVFLWEREYKDKWREYVRFKISSEKYDLIILGDRKGGELSDYAEVIPTEYQDRTIFASALNYFTERELQDLILGKNVLVIDDLFQHGRTFYKINNKIESYGPKNLKFVASAQNLDCVKKGLVEYPNVDAPFKFSGLGFRNYTSQLSSILYSLQKPLDNDHLQISLRIRIKDFSIERFVTVLSNMGFVHFPPDRQRTDSLPLEITINYPSFFRFLSFILPSEITEMGACKIRIFLSQNEIQIIPIAIPHISINPATFGVEADKTNKLLYQFCKPILEDKRTLEESRRALLFYEGLQLYFSVVMACQFIDEIKKYPFIDLEKLKHNVKRKDLVRRYGSSLGNVWHDILESTIYKTLNDEAQEYGLKENNQTLAVQENLTEPQLDPFRFWRAIRKLKKVYQEARKPETPFPGLDFNQLRESTGLDCLELSQLLDYALDRPLLKPKNEAVNLKENQYLCRRIYEPTEYFGINREQSDAYLQQELDEEIANALISHVILDIGVGWQGQQGPRVDVPPTLLNKVLVNLLLYASSDEFPPNMDFEPFLYGPVISMKGYVGSEADREKMFLREFSEIAETYNYDADRNSFFVDNLDNARKCITEFFERDELYLINGYLKIFRHIWNCDGKTNKTLIALSAVSTLKSAYAHAYKEVDIFTFRLRRFLTYLKTNLNQLNKEAVSDLIDGISEVPREMLNKINMYLNLEKMHHRLKDIFEKSQDCDLLGPHILDKLELPIRYSNKDEYPLPNAENAAIILKALILYVQSVFSTISLCDRPDEGLEKGDGWYYENLLALLKTNTIDYRGLIAADEFFRNRTINGKSILMIERQFDAIIKALTREEFLPFPSGIRSEQNRQHENQYKSILSAYSTIPAKYHTFKTVGCVELVRLTPQAEQVLEYSKKSSDVFLRQINKGLLECLRETNKEIGLDSFIQFDKKGAFLVVTDKPESMIEIITRIFKDIGKNSYRYAIPRVGLDFADEDPIFGGKYFGLNAIHASLISQDSRFKSEAGKILLTKAFFLQLPNHLQDLCEIDHRDYVLDSEGKKTDIYRFLWEEYDMK